ncbi:MAG: uracil-DNA glycosylase [Bacteroidia bacterium]|nr:uracil-DNA glycosylase [Bacteroidia bacterium]
MTEIEKFINSIANADVDKLGFSENLYKGNSSESLIRKGNLRLYLNTMKSLKPDILLIGEAPGYKGCRLTGIPFTSEKALYSNSFFSKKNYQFINQLDKLESEQSATMVWNELNKYERKPLIWNIFPFHPYNGKDLKTNRTPSRAELDFGKHILDDLLRIFDIEKIVAVGRKPESKLNELKINFEYVRHPANGGKKKFVEGLAIVMQ